MVAFYNSHVPGWIALDRKTHTLGNEHHTIACCETKIIFSVELVEGKDELKEGMNYESEFEEETGSKIEALFLHMKKSMWVSGRYCVLDSGFGYAVTVAEYTITPY